VNGTDSTIEITPHSHFSFAEEVKIGEIPTITFGFSDIQGSGVTGIQGTGVGTPKAAAVAAINSGLMGEWHIPNDGIFNSGLRTIIFATGLPPRRHDSQVKQ
jgi:hypothetical protein